MRIGLIAMSGVRCQDAELLEMGLTLPGFVERSKTIASLPSLGLLTLAGLTPDRHEVSYHEVNEAGDAEAVPAGLDLAAISSFTAQMPEAYAVADRLRADGVRVVIGGLHATALPDETLRHADCVVVGEAEAVWPTLLGDAEAGRLRPRYDGDGRFDLAESPMPRFSLLDMDRYNRITVQTSRGCPLKCEFCASSILLTKRYKQKPADRVLAEVDEIKRHWRRPFLEFADDNSFVNRAYWLDLLPRLAERRVKWFTECDLRVHRDEELLDAMRAAGCAEVLIGLESPLAGDLAGLELKTDWKRRRWGEYRDAVANIQGRGIRVNGCFILGLDGQTPAVFDAVAEFAEETGLFDVQVTVQTPFPGTPLDDRLRKAGRLLYDGLDDERHWARATLFDVNFEPDGMTAAELRAGLHGLVRRLYGEEATRRRREGFRAGVRSRGPVAKPHRPSPRENAAGGAGVT